MLFAIKYLSLPAQSPVYRRFAEWNTHRSAGQLLVGTTICEFWRRELTGPDSFVGESLTFTICDKCYAKVSDHNAALFGPK